MRLYYADFARGNFAAIITEGVYIDQAYSQAYLNQPGIVTVEQREGWRRVVDAVHAEGASMILQLMHAGALSQGNRYHQGTIAPSAVQPRGQMMPEYGGQGVFPLPREMSAQDIQDVIASFVRSALYARDAGFDGVEIHGANGYLIDQFLTTYTNQRTDRYGGSVKNRVRFAAEIVAAIREAVGPDYPVGIRLSQTKVNDFTYRWPGGIEEGSVIFSALANVGVSYLHLASEGRNWNETALLGEGVTITQLARKVAQVPVIANGGMHKPALVAEILEGGHGDLMLVGARGVGESRLASVAGGRTAYRVIRSSDAGADGNY